MNPQLIEIYTDGSCNTNYGIGAWVAILFVFDQKIVLKGVIEDTTHNRMELMAVIKAIEFAVGNYKNVTLTIYSDSQYVCQLPERIEKLKRKQYNTNKGTLIQNSDLVKILINHIETQSIAFCKVKAHQKSVVGYANPSVDFNREVDKLARKMVREATKHSDVDENSDSLTP